MPVWKLEKNQVTVEQTGRMPYPFSGNSGSTQVLERKSRISGEEEQSGGDSAKQSEVSWEDGRNNRE